MKRKLAVIGLTALLLTGCGLIKKNDPKPDQTQTVMMDDLSTVINDLDGFQTSQDDISDDALLPN